MISKLFSVISVSCWFKCSQELWQLSTSIAPLQVAEIQPALSKYMSSAFPLQAHFSLPGKSSGPSCLPNTGCRDLSEGQLEWVGAARQGTRARRPIHMAGKWAQKCSVKDLSLKHTSWPAFLKPPGWQRLRGSAQPCEHRQREHLLQGIWVLPKTTTELLDIIKVFVMNLLSLHIRGRRALAYIMACRKSGPLM